MAADIATAVLQRTAEAAGSIRAGSTMRLEVAVYTESDYAHPNSVRLTYEVNRSEVGAVFLRKHSVRLPKSGPPAKLFAEVPYPQPPVRIPADAASHRLQVLSVIAADLWHGYGDRNYDPEGDSEYLYTSVNVYMIDPAAADAAATSTAAAEADRAFYRRDGARGHLWRWSCDRRHTLTLAGDFGRMNAYKSVSQALEKTICDGLDHMLALYHNCVM